MDGMTRARKFLHAHPLLAMALGYLALVAFAMAVLPDDPPSIDAAVQLRSKT